MGGGISQAAGFEVVDVRNVKVGGEIGRRIDVTVDNNLMVLDADGDFLEPFRERTATGGYIGLGKLIDALVRFGAYTGDEKVLAKKDHVVREIIAIQEPDGYIGMFVPEKRIWSLWDIHEIGYLIYGLTMDYRFFGKAASLDAAKKAADYVIGRWQADPHEEPWDITTYMGVTGFEPALLALYDACHDAKYLAAAKEFLSLPAWDGPIVLGRWGAIQGHAYAYLARCLAQVRLDRIEPNPALRASTQRAMDFMLKEDGLVITGACGQHECWHDTQDGLANLGETCATAYLVRFLDELLRQDGNPLYGDVMERAIFNALFAAQSPDGRQIRYYAPFEGPRVYFDKDTYCCPCNYRRIVAELPSMVYYGTEDGIAVNLYAASKATVEVGGTRVAISQETDYPTSGDVVLHVEPSQSTAFALRLRIPRWCSEATVQVNDEPIQDAEAGTFHTVQRAWQAGDRVAVTMPMQPRLVKGRKAQAGRVAVMYGPTVFCLNLAQNPRVTSEDLRVITIDPATLGKVEPNDSVRPGGLKCSVKAWRTTSWYPHARHDWELALTEFPDPEGVTTYFHVPNPNDTSLVDDELALGAQGAN
ncbi:MAG TPA: glycoside hydrolase family 127 protein [Candidatus Hydrogenedentes bacterium]|nr:glycoside hydrolase family 127 protein [Candidatus Hydrogenedentota bacterium]HPG69012.1 glycoside hydrolase family 127 protein [Candidatus Hydrogenedentota bacterium]